MSLRDSLEVVVEVATGWTSPEAPRAIDAAALAEVPDIEGWLSALDAAGTESRLDLHSRTLTQFVRGEPLLLLESRDDWVRVVAPWQPTPEDPRGYPAWVRAAHVGARASAEAILPEPVSPADRLAIMTRARRHLGLAYLWGGTTDYGLDCSGLVHTAYRDAGVVVPRDAHAQDLAAERVPLGQELPGDLYFFARDDGHVFHVGFVSEPGRMLHAPESGRLVEEAELASGRRETLVAAGRLDVAAPRSVG